MNRRKICSTIALLVTLCFLALASSAFAVGCGGSPTKDALIKPYGLKIEGAAAGTKLTGVIEVSFSNIRCDITTASACGTKVFNKADAKAVLRLSRGENTVEAFYAYLGPVPYDQSGPDVGAVQTITIKKLAPPILDKFFGVIVDEEEAYTMIFLKDISPFYFAALDASPWPNAEFAAIADLTIAVDY